jgi:hypothetical protein
MRIATPTKFFGLTSLVFHLEPDHEHYDQGEHDRVEGLQEVHHVRAERLIRGTGTCRDAGGQEIHCRSLCWFRSGGG